jgi:hypothetical protein
VIVFKIHLIFAGRDCTRKIECGETLDAIVTRASGQALVVIANNRQHGIIRQQPLSSGACRNSAWAAVATGGYVQSADLLRSWRS